MNIKKVKDPHHDITRVRKCEVNAEPPWWQTTFNNNYANTNTNDKIVTALERDV